MTAVGEENMFGKQRGRFDELAARAAVATLPDRFLATFLSMTPALQDACIETFNGYHSRSPQSHRKFELREVGK